ncbi:MAG: hypothetical protein AAGF75_14630 [Cyanobacteria bacterium P01_H01_bin.130]
MSPLPGPSDPLSGKPTTPSTDPLGNTFKADFIERYGSPVEAPQSVSPAAKKLLNKVFLWVLLIGIAVGGLVSVGIAIALQRAGLLGVPTPTDAPAQVQPAAPAQPQ